MERTPNRAERGESSVNMRRSSHRAPANLLKTLYFKRIFRDFDEESSGLGWVASLWVFQIS